MQEAFIPFYLEGRAVKSLGKYQRMLPDADEIAEQITSEDLLSVRAAVEAACKEGLKPLETDRKKKRAWLDDHKQELDMLRGEKPGKMPMGVTNADDLAWHYYLNGIADELAYVVEADVLEELDEDDDSEDGDDIDDADDGEDDDDADESEKSKDA